MKKHLQLMLGTLISMGFGSAYAQWSEKPAGTTNGITAMKFTDARHGFACGEFNTILKTSNGGASWQPVNNGTIPNATFLSIDALDSNHLFVARNGLYVTENGGGSWSEWGNSASSIQSIKAINDSTAFITKGGFIFKTSDKGKNWITCYSFQDLTGPMIFTGNNDTAFACSGRTWDNASYGTIHRSVDGGKSWADLKLNTKQITAVGFSNSRQGYCTTFDNMFYATGDGGTTWNNIGQVAGGTDYITGILFADDSKGYAISLSGNVYRTGDGGKNWSVDNLVPRRHAGSRVPLSTITTCGEHIIIAGNDGFIIKNDGVLGIPRESSPQLRMFPNPVQQTLTIDLPDSTTYQTLRVYGIDGALVYTDDIAGRMQLQLEMQCYADGSYVVEIAGPGVTDRQLITKR
jgi:photosystem II stability/assembly factor-like uncharacterized protein